MFRVFLGCRGLGFLGFRQGFRGLGVRGFWG